VADTDTATDISTDTASGKQLLFVFRHAPYGSTLAREGLEAALAAGAYGQQPSVLFLDDGVWQLLADQNGQPLSAKTHQAMLGALPLYDVDHLYVDAPSLCARGIEPSTLNLAVTCLDAAGVKALLASSDVMLSF
jgi:tRNA 2-thiouridine synthesizing protein C